LILFLSSLMLCQTCKAFFACTTVVALGDVEEMAFLLPPQATKNKKQKAKSTEQNAKRNSAKVLRFIEKIFNFV